jgi:ribose 5-phosphate isomerase RpiB
LCETPEQAIAARRDDNINVLALAADFISEETARAIAQAYARTSFESNQRHLRRVDKIEPS